MRCSGFWLNGLTPSLAQYSHEGLCSAMGLLCTLNFANPTPITKRRFCHNSRPYKTRFGNEFGPSSLAADWGNHGCFLFLRWVICLSSAGSPAILRSVKDCISIEKSASFHFCFFYFFTIGHGIPYTQQVKNEFLSRCFECVSGTSAFLDQATLKSTPIKRKTLSHLFSTILAWEREVLGLPIWTKPHKKCSPQGSNLWPWAY